MSNLEQAYRAKLLSPEELVAKMRPGDAVTLGIWLGQSVGVMRALGRYGKNIDPLPHLEGGCESGIQFATSAGPQTAATAT